MMEQIWKLVLKREECPHVVRKVLTGEQSPLRSTGEITQAVQLLTRDEVVEVAFAFFFGGDIMVGYTELARGGFNWVSWDSKVLFSTALLCGANGITLAHNHPNNHLRMSRKDLKSLKRIIPAAELLSIKIYDYVVVTRGGYMSASELGLMPPVVELAREDEKRREEEMDEGAEPRKDLDTKLAEFAQKKIVEPLLAAIQEEKS